MRHRGGLAMLFRMLGFKIGVEVGVAAGKFSNIICEAMPGVKLFCVDVWEPYAEYADYQEISIFETLYNDAKAKLAQYDCTLIKKFSMDAVKDFEDESLDFVYIDSNHRYSFVRDDIREWTKKVKKGGIVSGHDYGTMEEMGVGVKQAVDEYVKEHNYQVNVTGERLKFRPSWWFIKT